MARLLALLGIRVDTVEVVVLTRWTAELAARRRHKRGVWTPPPMLSRSVPMPGPLEVQ